MIKKVLFYILLLLPVGLHASVNNREFLSDSVQIKYLIDRAKAHKYNPDSLRYYTKQLMKIGKETNNHEIIGKVFQLNGVSFFIKAQYPESVSNYKLALEEFKAANDSLEICKTLSNMGMSYRAEGDTGNSIVILFQALELADNLKRREMQASILTNIGLTYREQKNFKEAINAFKTALKLFKQEGEYSGVAGSFNNLADVYFHVDKFDSSILYNKKSVHLFDSLKDNWGMTFAYNDLAEAYRGKKDYGTSEEYSKKALQLSVEHEYTSAQIQALIGLGKTNQEEDKNKVAQQYFLQAIELLNTHRDRQQLLSVYKGLAACYGNTGDWKKSAEMQGNYISLKDSLSNTDLTNKIANLRTSYEVDKKDAEISLIKKNNEISKLYMELIILGLITVIVISIVFYLGQRIRSQNKIKQRLETEVYLRTKEIGDKNVELSKLNSVKDKLFSIISHDLRSPLNSLKGLISLYGRGKLSDTEEKELQHKVSADLDGALYLLNNLLYWASSQLEAMRYVPVNISLGAMVDKNIALFRNNAAEKSITVINTIQPVEEVWADKNMLSTIIRNLLSNAIKFTPNGGSITFSTRQDEPYAILSIADSGIGMPTEMVEAILESTAINSRYGTNHEKGTGIGLMLCKELAAKNGRPISIESVENKGTTIHVPLPAVTDDTVFL